MARWTADFVLLFRAVDIDKPFSRVGVVLVQTVKPQNPRHDEVFRWGQRIISLERHATLKNRAARHFAADFFDYAEPPGWRFHAAFLCSNSKSGSRNGIRADWRFVLRQCEPLISNRNVDISL